MKKQKGITLIALIITIIVMMILVGVTVSVSLNGGLFDTARRAAQETEKEAIYDQIVSAIKLKDNGKIDVEGTHEAVKNILGAQGKTVSELDQATGKFTVIGDKGEYTFKITEEQITKDESTSTPVIPNSPNGPEVEEPQPVAFPYGTYYMGGVRASLEGIMLEEDSYKYLWLIGESATTEIIDERNGNLSIDGESMPFKYFATDNNVVFLIPDFLAPVAKNANDVTFGLSGSYTREDGSGFYFDGINCFEVDNNSYDNKSSIYYFRLGDKYYFGTGDEFSVSADGKMITFNNVTYTNASANPIEEKEAVDLITLEGSDFIYGTYYVMSGDGVGIVLKEDAIMEAEIYENVTVEENENDSTITVALSEEDSFSINYIKTENNVILNSEDWGFTVALSETDLLYDLEGDYINSDSSEKFTFEDNLATKYTSWNGGESWSDKNYGSAIYCGYDGIYYFIGEKLEANADKTTLTSADGTVYTKQ